MSDDLNPRKRSVEEAAASNMMDLPIDATATAAAVAAAAAAAASPRPPAAKKLDVGNKAYKGLRHFSMMVCKKVEEKGTTSYNEVADELVAHVLEERASNPMTGGTAAAQPFDEKNIRRRVYDALNVLMAMDVIAKERKSITWKGLPTSATLDLEMLQRERDFRRQEVHRKRQLLQDLLTQQVSFRNLVERNRDAEDAHDKIPLPFIVVNTNHAAVIQCNMSRDKTDVMFDFSMPFEINDDNRVLKRLGLYVA
jgi:hypothetical protein